MLITVAVIPARRRRHDVLACSSARPSLSSRSVTGRSSAGETTALGAAAVPTAGASVPDWMAGARYEIIGSGRKEEIWQRSNRSNLHTRSSSPLITQTDRPRSADHSFSPLHGHPHRDCAGRVAVESGSGPTGMAEPRQRQVLAACCSSIPCS